ncbi:esterase family protein [Nocardia sp. NEAU-G5]|uniref:Esterase family protein n=2 Tax=Nocardia albiluteola TaxID=2842303 RepID=A0ABS6AQN9_9NOCA|nr:esterase family protein [Nocardia albiluteola]
MRVAPSKPDPARSAQPRPAADRFGRPGLSGWLWRTAVAMVLSVALPLGVAVFGDVAPTRAAFDPRAFDFWVTNAAMGPVKTRILRARDGNTDRVVYALDGMRARQDLNGWEIETNVAEVLANWNINVVMPVGGQSSFYANWNAPSSFLGLPKTNFGSSTGSGATETFMSDPGKDYRYDWETFLTRDLRNALHDRLGFRATRNGVFGVSMGGSAALTLTAYHPDQFSYAGSFSGYLNVSAPGMREAIRMAMIDAGGYNVDSMAPPWGPGWLRMDPFVFAPRLVADNTRLWVAAGSAMPDKADMAAPIGVAADRVILGMPLEFMALLNTRSFQVRMDTLGARNVVYAFPSYGIHDWINWSNEAYRMIPDMSRNIG